MSIENGGLQLPHASGVLCEQKRSVFGEGIDAHCQIKICFSHRSAHAAALTTTHHFLRPALP